MTPRQIKAARNWKGMSMQDLADWAGVSWGTVQKIESGGDVHAGYVLLVERALLSFKGIKRHGTDIRLSQ